MKPTEITKLALSQYESDCGNYRAANGNNALHTFQNHKDGKLWVVKKETSEEVILHDVLEDRDWTVTASDFSRDFVFFIQDEVVFFFGSQEQQQSAQRLREEQEKAVKRCVYGNPQLPVAKGLES